MLGESIKSFIETLKLEDLEKQQMIVPVAFEITFLVGMFQLAFFCLRTGPLISRYLLPPAVVSGFTVGAAFQIATSQIGGLTGMKIPRFANLVMVRSLVYFFTHTVDINWFAFLLGLTMIGMNYWLKWFDAVIKHFANTFDNQTNDEKAVVDT